MSKRLYVGNIPYTSTESDLKELFGRYAAVNAVSVILDHATGRSRGFAFVEMVDEASALKALEALHGYEYDGRVLRVNQAFERKKAEVRERPKRHERARSSHASSSPYHR